MNRISPFVWGAAVVFVALLNIAGILPDWTTITAILTLPFLASRSAMACRRRS